MEIQVMVDQIVKCSGQPKIRGSNEILVNLKQSHWNQMLNCPRELQYTDTCGQSHVEHHLMK